MTTARRKFITLVLIGMGNVFLSFIYGNQGYEAFLTVSIALGLLMTWQVIQFAVLFGHTKTWLIAKLLGICALVFFWAITMIAVIMPIADPLVDPKIVLPSANWLLVAVGVIPYVFSRILFSKDERELTKLATNMLATFFSIVTFFVAIVTFYRVDAPLRSLALVIAVELQFLLNYLITKTNYIQWVGNFANKFSSTKGTKTAEYTKLTLIALPFFTPIFIVALIAST